MEFINNYFSCPIHCCYSDNNIPKDIDNINYHQFTGPHPSGLTGTHINYIQPVSLENKAWTIGYQEVISLGHLLINGTLKTHKYISLGGPSVSKPSLLNVQVGGNIDEITAGKVNEDARIISGSVLNGHESEGVMNYLGFFHNQISAIPDEYNDIFTWLYKNLDLYTKDDFQYDSCVLAIREGMIKHTQVADPEINLSATLIEIARTLNDNK